MKNINEDEKRIDLELLLFYFCISIFSFIMFIFRYPMNFSFDETNINWSALFSIYSFDIFIFLIIFIPYIIIIIILVIIKLVKKKKYSDSIMIILFFPLFSFFTKGMSLIQAYNIYDIKLIIKNNFAFIIFIGIGPMIVLIHKIVVSLKKKKID